MKDLYKILEVEPSATHAEIKRKFRKLANSHHPDKNQGSKDSEEFFKEILNAYNVLSDPEMRDRYDEKSKIRFESTQSQQKSEPPKGEQKREERNHQPPKQNTYKPNYKKSNTWLWIVGLLIAICLYFSNQEKETTTGNTKADNELKQAPTERPTSGEINF